MDERYFTIDTKDLNFIESAQSKLKLTIDLSDEEFVESYFGRYESIILTRNGRVYAFTSEEFINGMNHMVAYVPERTATRKVRSFGEVGRCNCSACNWCIDPCDLFCRWCGARFTGTEYERAQR